MCDEGPQQPPQVEAEESKAEEPEAALVTNLESRPSNRGAACCGSCRRRGLMAKSLKDFILTMPSLNIYANIGFTLKNIQHETKFVSLGAGVKRPIALILLVCEPQFTEVLRSIADIQEKYTDTVYAEVKVTTTANNGATRLDVFCGRVDLAAQLRSNIIDEDAMSSVVLRVRLPHMVSGDCLEPEKVNQTFSYLTFSTLTEMVKKAFDDE